MRIRSARIAIALCAALCSHAFAQAPTPPAVRPVSQPNGDLIEMPQNLPASRRTGMTFLVDTRWVNAYGYRPVEVTISSPKPTTAAHTITVQLHSGWANVMTVEQDFEFPLGAKKTSTIVSVPFYEQSVFGFWWDVRVDGVKDIDLSMDKEDASRRITGTNVSASTVRLLVPGSQTTGKSVVSTAGLDFEVLSLELGEFPRRWIDYTCLDVVSLSTAELQQLATSSPAALESIERWVRTGGQLWVNEVGVELEKLYDVSKKLNVPGALIEVVAEPGVSNPGDQPAKGGWRPGRLRGGGPSGQGQGSSEMRIGRGRWVGNRGDVAQLGQDPNSAPTNEVASPADPNVERRWPSDSSQWYVEQRLGLGTLRAFRGENEAAIFASLAPIANASANVNSNVEASGLVPRAFALGLRATRRWDARHGLIPDSSNADFARLLIPGVGRAPVIEFQVLITLFVVLIGPFNYWILKRYKRLQLLVLTVPLAAGFATAALFVYAIVSEGFGTKVRIRSYTTIDQSTGEAACWARMSYYAGLAPGKGLTMPADVVMYPILPNWGSEDWSINRAMIWSADEALLTRGWLSSRTPTQYLMVRSRKTPHRIDVTSGNGKMQVMNRLGTRIESLLVLDNSGKFFTGDGLASESRVRLAPISRDQAVKRIVELMRDNEPEMPPDLSGSDRDFFGRRGRSPRRLFSRYRPQAGDGQLNENLASRALSDLAGMNGRPALDLPARSYVAVTTTGPEIETGIPNAEEEASFHVVVGRW